MMAETHHFVGLSAQLQGPVDIDALSEAFDALLEGHPILTAHLEPGADGRHQFVTDDLLPPGIDVIRLDDPHAQAPPPRFDQYEALVHLRLAIRGEQVQPTLYVHHAVADGHHMYTLIEELLSYYTDLVCNGSIGEVAVAPAPESIEAVLADRGIEKQPRSGVERFMPAMFAYDLPPSRRADTAATPASPVPVPVVWSGLSEGETEAIVAFGKAHELSLHTVLSAALLIAEWQLRGRTTIPVPYVYTVDLRYFLSPPVSATGCTNPIGVATYLAEINHNTSVVELARDIAATFQADLADGVIQQSRLHLSPQYVGNPPGLPDIVVLSNNGLVPPVRTPPGLEVVTTHGEMYFTVSAGIDIYFTQIFDGRLTVEYHSHGPDPQRSVNELCSVLRGIAERHTHSELPSLS